MRVSLARRAPQPKALPALLDPRGARTILGSLPGAPLAPIAPSPRSLFGPRGACLAAPGGPLYVCDTGHHRLLVWQRAPVADGAPADFVIGHPDMHSEGRNGLSVPTGVAAGGGVLALADAWNHRVLIWHEPPRRGDQPADVVLSSLNWPYGVALDEGRLYVADTGNRRVLVWDRVPRASGTAADALLPGELRWPHGIAARGASVYVADAGLGRIVRWTDGRRDGVLGTELGMPYGVALMGTELVAADTANSRLIAYDPLGSAKGFAGQASLADTGENRWQPAARDTLCWPYGIAACGDALVVADSGNNRVLLWNRA